MKQNLFASCGALAIVALFTSAITGTAAHAVGAQVSGQCQATYLPLQYTHIGSWSYREDALGTFTMHITEDGVRVENTDWFIVEEDPAHTESILADLANFNRVPPRWRARLNAASTDPEQRLAIRQRLNTPEGPRDYYKVLVHVPEADPQAGLPANSVTGFGYMDTEFGVQAGVFIFAPGCN